MKVPGPDRKFTVTDDQIKYGLMLLSRGTISFDAFVAGSQSVIHRHGPIHDDHIGNLYKKALANPQRKEPTA